jgi:hypothetical protein
MSALPLTKEGERIRRLHNLRGYVEREVANTIGGMWDEMIDEIDGAQLRVWLKNRFGSSLDAPHSSWKIWNAVRDLLGLHGRGPIPKREPVMAPSHNDQIFLYAIRLKMQKSESGAGKVFLRRKAAR